MVKITCDSAASLYRYAERIGVTVLPVKVIVEDREFNDGVNITAADIHRYIERTKIVPKTAAIITEDCDRVFGELSGQFDAVIHVSIGEKLSASLTVARASAAKFKNVFVVDSKNVYAGYALLVIKAVELANAGKSAPDIVRELERMADRIHYTSVFETLEYLCKGGRVPKITLLGANLLGIKPELQAIDGEMIPVKKFRGKQDVVIKKYITEQIINHPRADKSLCVMLYTRMPKQWHAMAKQMLKDAGFQNVVELEAGAHMALHCGYGALGVAFLV